jgi:hypothetical protein
MMWVGRTEADEAVGFVIGPIRPAAWIGTRALFQNARRRERLSWEVKLIAVRAMACCP